MKINLYSWSRADQEISWSIWFSYIFPFLCLLAQYYASLHAQPQGHRVSHASIACSMSSLQLFLMSHGFCLVSRKTMRRDSGPCHVQGSVHVSVTYRASLDAPCHSRTRNFDQVVRSFTHLQGWQHPNIFKKLILKHGFTKHYIFRV